MNFSIFKNVTRILTLACLMSSSLYASHPYEEGRDQGFCVNGFIQPHVDYHVFSYLGAQDHVSMASTSKALKAAIGTYYQEDSSHSYVDPFHRVRFVKEYAKPLMTKTLEGELSAKGFVIIPHGSSLVLSLPEKRISLSVQNLNDNFEKSSYLYNALFGHYLEAEDVNLNTKLQHLLTALPVAGIFLDPENSKKGALNFLNLCSTQLIESIHQITSKDSYWSFCTDISDEQSKELEKKPHRIVMTAAEFELESHHSLLDKLLESNPNHSLFLDIDAPFLEKYQSGLLPQFGHSIFKRKNLNHLTLTNRSNDIETIPSGFLSSQPNLVSFAAIGFTQLKTIDHFVLSYCEALNRIDTTGFMGVKNIGAAFSSQNGFLSTVDLTGFRYANSIDNEFMSFCISLSDVNLEKLRHVHFKGEGIFSDCWSLSEEDKRVIRGYRPALGFRAHQN